MGDSALHSPCETAVVKGYTFILLPVSGEGAQNSASGDRYEGLKYLAVWIVMNLAWGCRKYLGVSQVANTKQVEPCPPRPKEGSEARLSLFDVTRTLKP